MTIEALSQETFETLYQRGRRSSIETEAIQLLEAMTGIKFPCRWKHSTKGICNGGSSMRQAAKRHHFKVHALCRDATVYVFRYE